MKNNIVLIGPMGSGKSTLAQAVSRRGGFTCIDMDEEIVKRLGMSIPHIFEQYGESYFRELESDEAARAARGENTVIATGGGVVTVAKNMELLRATGVVIYLRCRLDTLTARTSGDLNRPLQAHLERLLEQREPLYRRFSDFTLDADDGDTEELAGEILSYYKGARSC